MRTTISKLFLLSILLTFSLSFANENPLKRLVNNKEFVNFTKAHGLNQNTLMNAEFQVTQFEILNSEIYEYNLAENKNLFIVKDKQSNKIQYFYRTVQANKSVILDKNNTNIIAAGDNLKCVSDTVDYMKKACDANTTCKISCDLSPNCIPYMYIIAYAHCASGNPAPKVASISMD